MTLPVHDWSCAGQVLPVAANSFPRLIAFFCHVNPVQSAGFREQTTMIHSIWANFAHQHDMGHVTVGVPG